MLYDGICLYFHLLLPIPNIQYGPLLFQACILYPGIHIRRPGYGHSDYLDQCLMKSKSKNIKARSPTGQKGQVWFNC